MSEDKTESKKTSRRSMLRLAVPAAAGVAALAATGASEMLHAPAAHAANGDPISIGSLSNTGTATTALSQTSTTGVLATLEVVDESNAGVGSSGLAGFSFNNNGVYGVGGGGFLNVDATVDKSYTGVYGLVQNTSTVRGYGVKAHANRGLAPLLLISSTGSSANGAPTTSAANGAMNVDSNGSLYSRRFGAWHPMATVNLFSKPIRVIDTRGGAPITNGSSPLAGNATLTAQITGTSVGGVSVPAHATAIIANMTSLPFANGDLTIWANGLTRPASSNLNYSAGTNIANFVICGLSSAGKVDIFAHNGQTHVILDIAGYII